MDGNEWGNGMIHGSYPHSPVRSMFINTQTHIDFISNMILAIQHITIMKNVASCGYHVGEISNQPFPIHHHFSSWYIHTIPCFTMDDKNDLVLPCFTNSSNNPMF